MITLTQQIRSVKQIDVNDRKRLASRQQPLALWHLLSLDAPTVAALWTWFFAAACHIHLSATAVLAMALAVWMLYAADRLLDTRAERLRLLSSPLELEERHHFHRANSRSFAVAVVCASCCLAALLPMLPLASIRLYGILGTLLFSYFVLIHMPRLAFRLPKELAVGFFFAAATLIPTVSRAVGLRRLLLPAAILFGLVCSLNCLFIYAWEHPAGSHLAHPATRLASRFIGLICGALIAWGVALTFASRLPWQIPMACTMSATLLTVLHSNRRRFDPVSLRASADLCLLTPILFLSSFR